MNYPLRIMETPFSIPTVDGKRIYGAMHVPALKTSSIAILVHGLTGHMDEYLHLTFARSSATRPFAVARFNQYDDRDGARRFYDSTISLHVADTKAVMKYLQSLGYEKLALIGHSLGAPVAIAAVDTDTRALVLWDPTSSPAERVRDWETRDPKHHIAYLDWQMRVILGEKWLEDAKTFPDSYAQLSQLKLPVKIIAAEVGGKLAYGQRYRAALGRDHAFAVVPNAGHTFVEEGAIEGLIAETSGWLNQHL
jgi:pimeloyl-ACP methyl ester carboxylesterase